MGTPIVGFKIHVDGYVDVDVSRVACDVFPVSAVRRLLPEQLALYVGFW